MSAKCTIDIYIERQSVQGSEAVCPYTPPSGNNLEHHYFPDSALPFDGGAGGLSVTGAVVGSGGGAAGAPVESAGWSQEEWSPPKEGTSASAATTR